MYHPTFFPPMHSMINSMHYGSKLHHVAKSLANYKCVMVCKLRQIHSTVYFNILTTKLIHFCLVA